MVLQPERGGIAAQILDYVMTFLGIIIALSPPALWFGWRQDMLIYVLSASMGSAVLYCILAWFEPPPPKRWGGPRQIKKVELSDEFLALLTDTAPLSFHHSRKGSLFFRTRMRMLKQLIKS